MRVKIYFMNEITKNNRRTSPLSNLDRDLVKVLCDVHPWGLKELCEKVGLDNTVLSHFFAGRRPLPSKVAVSFLRQIGLRSDGKFDAEYCFVFKPPLGMEARLAQLISLIFPKGGRRIALINEFITYGKAKSYRLDETVGYALFDGITAAVIHINDSSDVKLILPGKWKSVSNDAAGDALLSLDDLPKKSDVMVWFVAEGSDAPEINWGSVETEARTKGLTPSDVLQMIKSSHK